MKLTKTASGKKVLKLSRKEWQTIGEKAGWLTKLSYEGSIPKTSFAGLKETVHLLNTLKDDFEQVFESYKRWKFFQGTKVSPSNNQMSAITGLYHITQELVDLQTITRKETTRLMRLVRFLVDAFRTKREENMQRFQGYKQFIDNVIQKYTNLANSMLT